ncbi:MAG: FAD-binding domain-containing protein [Bacteroidota bacterium]
MKQRAIYWMKRDFRLKDNIALSRALAEAETVTPIFIVEPSFLDAPDTSAFHVHAITDALHDLRERLQEEQKDIAILRGEAVETLDRLYEQSSFQAVYAHEEVGTNRTYHRDNAVRNWCKQKGVAFIEERQTGVFRALKDRNKRHKLWSAFTFAELLPAPDLQKISIPKVWKSIALPEDKHLTVEDCGYTLTREQQQYVQSVSESAAEATLSDFLYRRSLSYRGGISSPLTAFTAGSRLSVHLAWGTMTGRAIYQATKARKDELAEEAAPYSGKWRSSLTSFLSRLHWRDHFIQRLETEPQMEYEALNPAYENLEYEDDPAFLEAWTTGMTGYPMVDACIRCMRATGFVNFRMRAMLTSFACHSLHLHWKSINYPMAKLYTDYEPGIHISQLQMQASVVGINTIRIYSPTKQIIDQDPQTTFIRQWIPELRQYTAKEIIAHVDEPLNGYPAPLVDWKVTSKEMRNRLWTIRKLPETKELASKVYEKHGSRKSPAKRKKKATTTKSKTKKTTS